MSFRERLQRATERGKQARAAQLNEAAAKALSEEECRRLHSQYRLTLTEHIENCLRRTGRQLSRLPPGNSRRRDGLGRRREPRRYWA